MSTWRTFGSSQRQGVEDPLQRNQKDEQERLRRQAEEQRRAAEAARQQQQQREARTNTINIPEVINQWAQPVTDWLNENSAQLGEFLGIRSAEETRRMQREAPEQRRRIQENFEREAYNGPINTFGSEAIRAVVGAPARLLEGVADTGILLKDTVSAPFVKDPTKNPFDARYVRTKIDLGVNGPKTPVGKMAEGLLTFGIAMRQAAARLPSSFVGLGTGGKGLKGAIASGLVPGAVADFLLTSPDDGNLSTLVRDMVPEEHRENFLLALAVDEDDNPWAAKLKATLEGGVSGAVVDTLGWMLIGRRAAQRALKAGASKDEAAAVGLKAAEDAQKKMDQASLKKTDLEAERWTAAQEREMEIYLDRERRLMEEETQLREAGVLDDDPRMSNLRLEMEENRLNMAQLDNEIMRGYNPDDPQLTPFEKAATNDVSNVNTVVAQQLRLEDGPIPNAARSGNLPPSARVNQAVMGGSDHILTDAAYRILNLDEGVEQLVKNVAKRADIQALAQSLGKTDQEVLDGAARVVQNVRDATRDWREPTDNIAQLLREQGAMLKVEGDTNIRSNEVLSREGVVALKALITDTSNQIFELATNADKMLEVRTAGGNQFDRMMDRLVTMLEFHKEAAVFHGGGLRAFGMDLDSGLRGVSLEDNAQLTMKEVREWAAKVKDLARRGDPEAQEEAEALIRAMVLAGGDPSKTVNFMKQAAKYGWQSMMDGMYNSMLSGPITHVRNTFGNLYSLLERPASVAISGLVKGDETLKRSAMAGFHGIATSVSEAWEVFGRTLRTGDSVNLKGKFLLDDFETEAMIRRMEQVAKSPNEERAIGVLKAMRRFFKNPIMDFPSRVLTASDDFFRTLVARQQISTDAMYRAMTEASNPDDVDQLFKHYMDEFSKKIDPTTGRILDPDLIKVTEQSTFQQDPGAMINHLTNFMNAVPGGRVFLPFIRTPANLMNYAGLHTPGINRFLSDYKAAMASGDAIRIAEMEGRQAIGTMVVSAAGLAAMSGLVTGNGPADPRERAIWEKTHAPMSIKIGDSWISYQGIEPLASIASTAADIGMLLAAGAENDAERLAGQLAFAIGAAVTEKSFVAGLADIAAILDPKNMTPDGFTRSALGTANNFLPFAGARRTLTNILDPYLKEVNGELERAMNAALPGYKLLGTTKIDWLTGEEMSSSAGGFWNALVPLRIVKKGADPVKDMLVDIRFEMGDSQNYGPAGVELTAEQRSALNKGMAESGMYQKLDKLRKQDWFKKDVAAWKAKGFKWSTEENRPRHYQAVQRIINDARRTTFSKMQRTDPGFAEMVREARRTTVQYRRGVYDEVQTLTNFPN